VFHHKQRYIDDLEKMLDMTFQYLVFGFETGGKKKVCHIQGYVYFNNALSQSSVKKKLPRAHLEVTKGTPDQNFDYTSKDGDFYEFGEKPLSGRACFDKIEEAMKDPINHFHLYHQYRKAYHEYKNSIKLTHDPILIILSEKDIYDYAKKLDGEICIWPSEYDGERVIIEPCYTSGQMEILPWLNKFPLKYKNGYEYKTRNPEILVITYKDDSEKGYLLKNYQDHIDEVF